MVYIYDPLVALTIIQFHEVKPPLASTHMLPLQEKGTPSLLRQCETVTLVITNKSTEQNK